MTNTASLSFGKWGFGGMTTKVKFTHKGKTITKEDKRDIFDCLKGLIKWKNSNNNAENTAKK